MAVIHIVRHIPVFHKSCGGREQELFLLCWEDNGRCGGGGHAGPGDDVTEDPYIDYDPGRGLHPDDEELHWE